MVSNLMKKDPQKEAATEEQLPPKQPDNNQKEAKKSRRKRKKQYRIRKFPIWLRIIVILIIAIFALIAGLMVGYGVLGDGNPIEVLDMETWQHIIDIIGDE